MAQRHGHSHVGIVFFGGLPMWVPSLMRSVSLVEEWERSSLCICHIAFLCPVIRMLLKWCLCT